MVAHRAEWAARQGDTALVSVRCEDEIVAVTIMNLVSGSRTDVRDLPCSMDDGALMSATVGRLHTVDSWDEMPFVPLVSVGNVDPRTHWAYLLLDLFQFGYFLTEAGMDVDTVAWQPPGCAMVRGSMEGGDRWEAELQLPGDHHCVPEAIVSALRGVPSASPTTVVRVSVLRGDE